VQAADDALHIELKERLSRQFLQCADRTKPTGDGTADAISGCATLRESCDRQCIMPLRKTLSCSITNEWKVPPARHRARLCAEQRVKPLLQCRTRQEIAAADHIGHPLRYVVSHDRKLVARRPRLQPDKRITPESSRIMGLGAEYFVIHTLLTRIERKSMID
jgi:hypothetical protein